MNDAPSIQELADLLIRVIRKQQYYDYAPARYGIIDGAGGWTVTANNQGYPFTFEAAGQTTNEGRALDPKGLTAGWSGGEYIYVKQNIQGKWIFEEERDL